MCGIVGAIAQRNVSQILLEGLSRLEYRGYDSAGICTISDGEQHCIKTTGKVKNLKEAVKEKGCPGFIGIAHTRWATHGIPSETNAHPHICENLALVHNGIIENFASLKEDLLKQGYQFKSQTDTEVLVCLIHSHLKNSSSVFEAFKKALKEVKGSFGLALIDKNDPDTLYAARSGSPLIIGLGIGENFIASDTLALLPVTRRFIYLEENELAVLTTEEVNVYDLEGNKLEKQIVESDLDAESISKGKFRHFMQKEIYEQPQSLRNTLLGRLNGDDISLETVVGADENTFRNISSIQIVACGTSYHAGLVGRYWLEELTGIATNVEIASEYRYRKAVVRDNSLFITISQSGETADTLASLRLAKEQNYSKTLSICNVNGSSLVRESDFTLFTKAGAEIGVASTKAFTTQLLSLLILALIIGKQNGSISAEKNHEIIEAIRKLPSLAEEFLSCDKLIATLSEQFSGKRHCLFLGRGVMFPIALEGALKLKEISYIHAEGYAAGELKHGPIALIDKEMPVVVVAPDNSLMDKLISNVEEVRARGAQLYIFKSGNTVIKSDGQTNMLSLPDCPEILQPILFTIPLQLLSYHCAVINGTDVDQPRNLAKSVTVE
ncbi:glucosamine--fructose-6-phosphate aminotransferase (isomerizing) [Succinivibrio dextrinosolvens DSM 3072]|uniref:Glutamine--fructose-6-phosphate aminotransferase [isomerizing] n=1 Tax=Succinivibrio dextrinosolvens DSM 3072 TaxID=1123324 RepID=A0A1T4UXN8_9GAMM|nr:glutamine--fructose-6-phosphate transaminase (isomerizing) [Succinivibrio dextrinosolvens]SKA57493.1 glucosamine--fructose-6-phosphate aminotransferase (isomerizing) [Succinivibrio dextrinosolvens DSM 3072]